MNKIVKIIFIFALCLFISGLLDAQSITWERIYDGPDEFNLPDGGYDICEADSGNYYLAGYATFQSAGNRPWIIKINSFGDTIWTCVIRSIVATSAMACARSKDGGCVVTGDGTQPWVAKLDRNGNVNWLRVYPGYITRVYSIINSSDGGYAACGKTMYDSAIVFKIDSIGELDWIKVFRAGNYIRFDDISEIYNGYMLTGNISGSNSGFQFPMIFKVNKSGGFIGKKIYNEFYNSVSNSIQNINNDEYLIGGSCRDSTNTRNQGFMMRIDTSGSILFKKVFYSDYSESLNDVVIISDNRYALAYMKSMGILMFGKASIVDSAGKVYFEKEGTIGKRLYFSCASQEFLFQ